jgi:allantoicase
LETLLPQQKLSADHEHEFSSEELEGIRTSASTFSPMVVSRLRLFGKIVK